jgi:O-methyltransferase
VSFRSTVRERIASLPPEHRKRIDAVYKRLPIPPNWSFNADGLATVHFSPFVADPGWSRLYDEMARQWFQDEVVDARWRMWLLTRFARQARHLDGNFAEYGTYRGGCAWMLLSTAELDDTRRLHLFDTFEGIPETNLSESERAAHFGGRLADTTADYVRGLLSRWDPIAQVHAGDVFDTVPAVDTGPLAFVHVDLNAAAPTRHVLEHAYERLVTGGIVVFDDYGFGGYEEQRREIDGFVRDRPEDVIALPTGQALLIKA